MSGGAIQTPQLLQLSGIGDPIVLKKLGIDVVVDLPGVGANLQDHAGAFSVGAGVYMTASTGDFRAATQGNNTNKGLAAPS